MKKKILNALLMGVLVMTSMSVFVSCKDYDDDIDDLRLKQTDLLTQLESLQSSVDSQTSSITSQITSLQSSLSSLSTELQGDIADAASAAQAAGSAAAAAQTSADDASDAAAAAQATADAALAKAQEALEAAEDATASTTAATALEKVTELSNKLGSLETLTDGIAGLVEQVNNAATQEELDKLDAKVDKYESYFNSLFAMVTSVELYGTVNGSDATFDDAKGLHLDLLYGTVTEKSTFGNDEAYDQTNTSAPYATASTTKEYNVGDVIKQANTGIILRVNPVNATFTKDQIKVINSKGESLDDYIEISEVKPYTELLTRASSINSGLWKVAVQFKGTTDTNKFKEVTETSEEKSILFAVAINNTDTISAANAKEERYVASTYDLTLASDDYEPLDELNFSVKNNHGTDYRTNQTAITEIITDEAGDPKTNTLYGAGDGYIQNRFGKYNGKEYTWKANDTKAPYTKMVIGDNQNVKEVASGDADNRSTGKVLPVEVGQEFTVSLYNPSDKIDYYYVTLDKNFTEKDSAPSEWNAWNSYSYEGLKELTKASDALKLKVTSDTAEGDEIGFRVYAVNYDGTLVDPDGKAFYVQVGKASGTNDATATIKVQSDYTFASDVIKLDGSFNSFTPADTDDDDVVDNVYFSIDTEKSSKTASGYSFAYAFYKDAAGKQSATNWKDANYVKITSTTPGKLEDGGTFVLTWTAKDGDRIINTLNVTVKKEMPTTTATLSFKTNQLNNGVYNCYVEPTGGWTATDATTGHMTLVSAVNGLDNNANFTWSFAGAKYKDEGDTSKGTEALPVISPYNVTVHKDFVDNGEKSHATTVKYCYPGISYAKDEDGNWQSGSDFYVTWDTAVTTNFCCALHEDVMSFSLNAYEYKSGNTTVKENINYIVYGDKSPAKDSQWAANTSHKSWEYYLNAANKYDNNAFGGSWSEKSIYNKFLTVKAELRTAANDIAEYYNVTVNSDGTFSFELKKNSAGVVNSAPTADVPSKLYIIATDAFGHEHKYAGIDFTIKVSKAN